MYKPEPAIANGGEVVIYAPHLTEISYTHGRLIDEVGYHVLEYFTKQRERFTAIPGVIKAHSTHVKGLGTYDTSSRHEEPRIQVTLAPGIPTERCAPTNLPHLDPPHVALSPSEAPHPAGVLGGCPASIRPAPQAAMRSKHCWRPAAVSGCPARLLAMFDRERSASPDESCHPIRVARMRATVVLPLPETPSTPARWSRWL